MIGFPAMDSFGTAIGVNAYVSLMKESAIEGEAELVRF